MHPHQQHEPVIPDALSPRAATILRSRPGVAYTRLTVDAADGAAAELLRDVTPQELLLAPPKSEPDARAMLAGLWLWHDGLHESHEISQKLTSSTGSFWHAIMHRREGDFSNAKYWYARCRHHPVLAEIPVHAESSVQLLRGLREVERVTRSGWDADAYVDLVEQVHANPADPRHAAAVRLQQIEWRCLFAHCVAAATGGAT